MATLEQIGEALRKAHDAGDTENARLLAQAYASQRDSAPQAKPLQTQGYVPESEKLVDNMPWHEAALVGVGKGMTDAAEGVTSLFGKGDLLGVGDRSESDAALKKSTAANIGDVAGNIAITAPSMFIPGANTLKGATLIGGATGALTNKGSLEDRAKSAGMGAAGGLIGASLPYAANVAEKVFAPFGSTKSKEKVIGGLLNTVTGDRAERVADRLINAKQLVPGSEPTAAEVGLSGGLASLQRAMSAANPEAYTHRGLQQSAARVGAIRNIAKDEQELQKAIGYRDSTVKPIYNEADAAHVPGDDELVNLMGRLPKGTMQRAQDIARMENKPIQFGKNVPATQRESGLLDAKGNPILVDVPAEYQGISGRGIDLIKKAIDDRLDPQTTSIGKSTRNASKGVKDDLLAWADAKIPKYAEARQTYQALSRPIDQMKVGQELLNRLEPALARHGALGSESKAMYARALNDVRGNLVKQSTGGISKKLEDVMTPEQMQALNAVAQDLARKANAENLGRGVGSNTFQNFALNGIAQAAGVPSAVNGLLQLFAPTRYAANTLNAVGKKMYEGSEREMKNMLADALLNPKETARLMAQAKQRGLLSKLTNDKPLAISGLLGAGLANTAQQ